MAIAVRMFMIEVGDVVPVILEPMHGRTALAKERGDIAFVRFFDHLRDRQVFPQINLLLIHHHVVNRYASDASGSFAVLNAGTRRGADR